MHICIDREGLYIYNTLYKDMDIKYLCIDIGIKIEIEIDLEIAIHIIYQSIVV